MHSKTKQKKWWKRSLTVMLSLTLVTSSVSLTGLPKKAQAADPVNPGGVSTQPVLWLKSNEGVKESAGNLTHWADQSVAPVNFTLDIPTGQEERTPKYNVNGVNFNPSVKFDNPSGAAHYNQSAKLVGDKQITFQSGYAVYKWPEAGTAGALVGSTEIIKYGTQILGGGGSGGNYFAVGTGANSTWRSFGPANRKIFQMANYEMNDDGTKALARINGQLTTVGQPTITIKPITFTPVIGATGPGASGSNFSGLNADVAEVILYDGETSADAAKIETYLAVKYGITLNDGTNNYVATNNAIVWDATENTKYQQNIAGIGRDDAEELEQKQSRSINEGTQVAIGVDALTATNLTNQGTLTDGQYLIWADNGKDLAFTKQIGTTNKNHAERIWKVQNTGSVGEVEIAIPKSALPENTTLRVGDSDTDFALATEYTLTEITLNGAPHYAAKATLANSQYFTFAADAPAPLSVKVEEITANQNQIIVTFDKDIKLTAPEATGFTVTVGTETITLTDADVKVNPADPKQLLITLPGTDTTGKSVKVEYDGQGKLTGTDGVPVNSFEETMTNTAIPSLQITEPTGKVNTKNPDIKGTVDKDATVRVVIKDKDGNEVPNASGNATVDGSGNWAFTPSIDLVDGDYTIEVEAKRGDKIAKQTVNMTVDTAAPNPTVGVTAPTETVSTGKPTFTGTATPGATVKIEISDNITLTTTADEHGNWSITPNKDIPNGTYNVEYTAEINGHTSGIVSKLLTVDAPDKSLLATRVEIVEGLTKEDYTPESWNDLEPALSAAKAVLDNPNSTQADIDAAYNALKAKHDALEFIDSDKTVDKTNLQKELTIVAGFSELNYTLDSWSAFETAKKDAQDVFNDLQATQEEVNAAWEKLVAARHALIDAPTAPTVDKTALQAKVNESTNLSAGSYTPESWSNYQKALNDAIAILTKGSATQTEIDDALQVLTAAQNALVKKPTQPTSGLGSLTPSTGALSPNFSSEVTNYTMNVNYATSQLTFTALPSNSGATVTMTVNGQVVTTGLVPLQVGANTVVITVQDGTGVKQYTITVYRAADSSSGSGGGGDTWTTAPTPPTTTKPGTTTTKIQVALEIDGENPLEKTTVEIERTKHANSEITDVVVLTEANSKEAVEKAKRIGNNIVRIVIPDVNDEVDKVTIEIPKQSLQLLHDNGLSLEFATENGLIAIPLSSMDGLNDNFYFRLVPVKKESERKAIEERARVERVVRETLQSNNVRVVARPMTIETNMPSRPVQVTLPLKGVKVPTDTAERQAFLDQLAVFIEHSDGEKKVVFPEVVTMAKGELGLRFTVNKFSTFTIIQVEKKEEQVIHHHEAYIKGFPDGTFGPEKNVTRAQVATMIARILGYTDGTVDTAPFKDVAKDHSAAGAIAFVKEQGIMNGDDHGNFHAGQNITRAEMAAVVANYKQLSVEQGVAITFKDTKGHWAQWIIEANRNASIINGRADSSFAPDEHLTRAQAVVMMNRMFERGSLQGVTTPSFPDVKASHWAFNEIEEAAKPHAYFIDEEGQEQIN
ncbi:S-layer homology domain-containing protein [Lysinibacillus sp. NPDC059133]|uniref:S-layer homology domain-containing protein n=1 Tax=Lysinibacillus sp. NPDC059133 TaxID=3346737 RepID=UPI0036C0CFDE